MKAPCYGHDSFDPYCADCAEMNGVKPLPEHIGVDRALERIRQIMEKVESERLTEGK